MKRDISIQKSFRREINLQTRSVSNKKFYTRKLKHKKGSSHDGAFRIEGCIMRRSKQTFYVWESNAA
jgi:hypothetical protein